MNQESIIKAGEVMWVYRNTGMKKTELAGKVTVNENHEIQVESEDNESAKELIRAVRELRKLDTIQIETEFYDAESRTHVLKGKLVKKNDADYPSAVWSELATTYAFQVRKR